MEKRIYRVRWHDPSDGNCLQWFASKREAEQYAREVVRESASREENPLHPEMGPFEAEPKVTLTLFPTTKRAIIGWLNVHLDRDNG